jgi:hypothetical protein
LPVRGKERSLTEDTEDTENGVDGKVGNWAGGKTSRGEREKVIKCVVKKLSD